MQNKMQKFVILKQFDVMTIENFLVKKDKDWRMVFACKKL